MYECWINIVEMHCWSFLMLAFSVIKLDQKQKYSTFSGVASSKRRLVRLICIEEPDSSVGCLDKENQDAKQKCQCLLILPTAGYPSCSKIYLNLRWQCFKIYFVWCSQYWKNEMCLLYASSSLILRLQVYLNMQLYKWVHALFMPLRVNDGSMWTTV